MRGSNSSPDKNVSPHKCGDDLYFKAKRAVRSGKQEEAIENYIAAYIAYREFENEGPNIDRAREKIIEALKPLLESVDVEVREKALDEIQKEAPELIASLGKPEDKVSESIFNPVRLFKYFIGDDTESEIMSSDEPQLKKGKSPTSSAD